MHDEVLAFFARLRRDMPWLFIRSRVVEVGSRDINGSLRPLFDGCEYIGIDALDGPGVDVMCEASRYVPPWPCDVIVSTEALEHDPQWQATVRHMVSWLAPGGCLLLSWATHKRPAHNEADSPQPGYYRGLALREVVQEVEGARAWYGVRAELSRNGQDGYLYAHDPTISVVVPAVGQPALTACCIAELRRLARVPLEIILVDNGSSEHEQKLLDRCGADQVVRLPRMVGYPTAVNLGVEQAHGRYLLLLNNDAWPSAEGWDTRLISVIESVERAGVVVPVCPRVYHPYQRAHNAQETNELIETDAVAFVAAFLRRRVWDEIGVLDERFGIGNYEDNDYCARLRQAGYRVLIDPATFFFHVGSVTMLSLPELNAIMARSRQEYLSKWRLD